MSTEYNHTNLGDINVHNDVIKNIALKTATEIHGIYRMRKPFLKKIRDFLTKRDSATGAKLEFINESEAKIVLYLMIDYGVNIPYAAGMVQENVKKSVEQMTGLMVTEVVIKIIGMQAKKPINLKDGLVEELRESLSVK